MADPRLLISVPGPVIDPRLEEVKLRERALARMLMTYIGTGLAFMLLPGTFLGVWNLIAISDQHAANSISAAWIQAHGQAQVFGWIGTFILGIGFYSIPKMRRSQPFAMWAAWTCYALWSASVLMRWISGVYAWHWRVLFPVTASLQLLAFIIFFHAVSSHRPASPGGERPRFERWIFVVMAASLGLLATLIANLAGSIQIALHSDLPAFGQSFDQRFLVLMAWGFMVPFVWGFSARWLSTFVGLRTVCERGLMVMLAVNTSGVVLAMFGWFRLAVFLLLAGAVLSTLAIRVAFPAIQPAKTGGIHKWFPYFVRLAYGWLIVAGALGVWAAFAKHPDGIWGASRHALTVGFVATMVFAIGQRVLPAFSGMRVLFSPRLMGWSLSLLLAGCSLRVVSEVLAYQSFVEAAWKWLPVSAVTELTAVTLFAINMVATFFTRPPSEQLVRIK